MLAKFHLTDALFSALGAAWLVHFDRDPALYGRFKQLVSAPTGPAPSLPPNEREARRAEPTGRKDRDSSPAGALASAEVTVLPSTNAAAPSLPFAAAPTPLMSIERYAEMTAALEREADPVATFARFGIQPDIWMATLQSYSRVFAENTFQQAIFHGLLEKARRSAR